MLLGGKRVDRPGYFLEPTILTNVKPDNPVFHQEFFAPVALVFRVKNEAEAVKLANDSPYGLGGSIITKDVPPDALAVARARQENKEGYAARHRDD